MVQRCIFNLHQIPVFRVSSLAFRCLCFRGSQPHGFEAAGGTFGSPPSSYPVCLKPCILSKLTVNIGIMIYIILL